VGLQRKTEGLRTSGIHEWKDYEVKDLHARQHVDERLRIASANRPRTAQIDPARHEHVHPSVAHPGVDPRDTKEVEPSYVHDRWCHPSVSMAEIRSRAASGYADARRSGAQRLLAVSQSSDALVRERTSKQQALEIEASNNLHRRHTIEVVQNKSTKASKQHQVDVTKSDVRAAKSTAALQERIAAMRQRAVDAQRAAWDIRTTQWKHYEPRVLRGPS